MPWSARSEFYLCLAHAFTAPTDDQAFSAFVSHLADDLDDLASRLSYPVVGSLLEFRCAVNSVPSRLALLQSYASLFLTPPAPVPLNTAIYLDGSILGPSELDLDRWYAAHGLGKSEDFHDLCDHVVTQLEFTAFLFAQAAQRRDGGDALEAHAYATEARRFLAAFPHRWARPLVAALTRAGADRGAGAIYLHLADVLRESVACEVAMDPTRSPDEAVTALPAASARGIGEPSAADLAAIARKLANSGLSFEHVRARPEWRQDLFDGMSAHDAPRTT